MNPARLVCRRESGHSTGASAGWPSPLLGNGCWEHPEGAPVMGWVCSGGGGCFCQNLVLLGRWRCQTDTLVGMSLGAALALAQRQQSQTGPREPCRVPGACWRALTTDSRLCQTLFNKTFSLILAFGFGVFLLCLSRLFPMLDHPCSTSNLAKRARFCCSQIFT